MSPARNSLVCLSLLIGLLFAILVVTPGTLLVAQDSATPTAIPYDQLPICPPLILNPTLPTPIAYDNAPVCRGPFVYVTETPTLIPSPTPTVLTFNQLPICPTPPADFTPMPADDSLSATCRADVKMDTDVKALIEQGIDPATLGLADPRDENPELFVTPTPAIAADTPNQAGTLYLPVISGGQVSADLSRADVEVSDLPYPGWVPVEQLPICPEMTTIDSTKLPPVGNSNSAPVCRIEAKLLVDVRDLIEQGIDPVTVGVGGDATSGTSEPALSTPSPYVTPIYPEESLVAPLATPDAPKQTSMLYLPSLQGNEPEAVSKAREFFTTNESVNVFEAMEIIKPLEVADEPAGLQYNLEDPNSFWLPPGINTKDELPTCNALLDDAATEEDEVLREYAKLDDLEGRPQKRQYILCRTVSQAEGTPSEPTPVDEPDCVKNTPAGLPPCGGFSFPPGITKFEDLPLCHTPTPEEAMAFEEAQRKRMAENGGTDPLDVQGLADRVIRCRGDMSQEKPMPGPLGDPLDYLVEP